MFFGGVYGFWERKYLKLNAIIQIENIPNTESELHKYAPLCFQRLCHRIVFDILNGFWWRNISFRFISHLCVAIQAIQAIQAIDL